MKILGCIIAGGSSSRMGQDKALIAWRGRMLIEHVAMRLGPQVDLLVINSNNFLPPLFSGEGLSVGSVQQNQNPSNLNHPHPTLPREGRRTEKITIIPDLIETGTPLAGLQAALTYVADNNFDAVLTAPCDCPLLPWNLRAELEGEGAAIATSGGQAHYLTGFWPVATLPLLAGLRRVQDFARAVQAREVSWAVETHDPFFNVNTPNDLAQLPTDD